MTLTEWAQPAIPAAALVASVSADGVSTVVAFRGEADVFTLPVVVDVLGRVTADTDGPVVVDLAETDFIDAGAVRAVAQAWEVLRDRGRALTVRSPSRVAVRVLDLFGLTHVVDERKR